MTKNRTPTPVYLDPGMHSGPEVKGLSDGKGRRDGNHTLGAGSRYQYPECARIAINVLLFIGAISPAAARRLVSSRRNHLVTSLIMGILPTQQVQDRGTRYWPCVDLMLARCQRHWTSIKPTPRE